MLIVTLRSLTGLITLSLLAAGAAFATPEYGRKSGKECNYCHPAGNYQLTDAGKYYQQHKSLKGYVPPVKPDANAKGTTTPPAARQTGHS
jgi:hypothetical protein